MLGVTEQGYYQWYQRKREAGTARKERLLQTIRRIFFQHKRRYGSPRVYQDLKEEKLWCGETQVAKLMREAGLRAKAARKFRITTKSGYSRRVAENVLKRRFKPDAPNKVWCGDITYLWTREGFSYLAVFLDLYSRRIVGWSVDRTLSCALVLEAFRQAVLLRQPGPGLIVHTDRGSQYTSDQFIGKAQAGQFVLSMSRRGNCWDNAVVESFFNTLKIEAIKGEDVRTRWQLRQMLIEYIDQYYNSKRRHSTIDYLAPIEYEKKKWKVQECGK